MKEIQLFAITPLFFLIIQTNSGPSSCLACVLPGITILALTCRGAAYACLVGSGPLILQCLSAACRLAAQGISQLCGPICAAPTP